MTTLTYHGRHVTRVLLTGTQTGLSSHQCWHSPAISSFIREVHPSGWLSFLLPCHGIGHSMQAEKRVAGGAYLTKHQPASGVMGLDVSGGSAAIGPHGRGLSHCDAKQSLPSARPIYLTLQSLPSFPYNSFSLLTGTLRLKSGPSRPRARSRYLPTLA
jgi:hypothetical protein